jgi:DNA polymerase III alpha subunit (gram-positive type)
MNHSDYVRTARCEGREVADEAVMAEAMAPHYVLIRCQCCGTAVDVAEKGHEYTVDHCPNCEAPAQAA